MMKRILQLMIIVVSLFALSGSVFAASNLIDVAIKDSQVTELGEYASDIPGNNYKNGKYMIASNEATKSDVTIPRDKPKSDVKSSKDKPKSEASSSKDKPKSEASSSKDNKSKSVTSDHKSKPKQENSKNWLMIFAGAIIAGILGAYLYGEHLKASMSNVAFAVGADQYMKEGSFHLTESDDTFMFFTYARVPKNKKKDDSSSDDDGPSDDDSYDDSDSSSGDITDIDVGDVIDKVTDIDVGDVIDKVTDD